MKRLSSKYLAEKLMTLKIVSKGGCQKARMARHESTRVWIECWHSNPSVLKSSSGVFRVMTEILGVILITQVIRKTA